jgi:hypothetical protein
MKKLILSIVAIVAISLSSFGQVPEGFKYQAVVRDAGNLILNNQTVGIQLTIQQGSIGGTAVYTETFLPTTNAYGLVNLEIGTGTSTDDFSAIDWSFGSYFIETAVDISGGTSYAVMGTSKLMSVPYALYAKTSGNGQGPIGPQGPAGNDGVAGIQGLVGNDGAAGTAGAQGPVGNDGAVGLTGPVGAQGPAGINGAQGAMGPQGLSGNDGAAGSQGPAGINGANGTNGSVGPQGPAGTNGTNGTTGATGGYPVHTIGESYGGGIVFYVYDGGQHGLIASPADQSSGIRWYGGSFTHTRARGNGVGTGLRNTAIIISNQGAVDGNDFAATLCNEYWTPVGVQYADWYLPSKHELNLLYLQKNVVGGFTSANYWSSTEIDNVSAGYQDFSNGVQFNGAKISPLKVRAIRAF